MKTKLDIPEIISSIIVLLNLYIISILPLGFAIKDYIYYIQLLLFLLFLVTKLDIAKVLNYNFQTINLILYLEIFLGIIFIFITLLICWDNNSDIKSIIKIITYILLFVIFFNFYSFCLISNIYLFNKFINAIVLFALVNSVFGWLVLFFGPKSSLYGGFHLGLFYHPNTNSFIYSLSIPIVFYKIVFAEKRRIHELLSLLLLFVTMLFTFSRATFIGVGVALSLIMFFKSKKYTVLLIIIVLILSVTVLDYFLLAKGGFSSFSRILLFYTAFEMIIKSTTSFLFGYGVFHSLEIFFTEKLFLGSFEIVVDPHNMVLLLAIQFGMIITTAFLTFIVTVLISGIWNLNKLNNDIKGGAIISLTLCVNLIVQNQFEDIIVYPEYFVYPFFLIFLGYLYHTYKFKIN